MRKISFLEVEMDLWNMDCKLFAKMLPIFFAEHIVTFLKQRPKFFFLPKVILFVQKEEKTPNKSLFWKKKKCLEGEKNHFCQKISHCFRKETISEIY